MTKQSVLSTISHPCIVSGAGLKSAILDATFSHRIIVCVVVVPRSFGALFSLLTITTYAVKSCERRSMRKWFWFPGVLRGSRIGGDEGFPSTLMPLVLSGARL
jgi:hypothetical protein